jgi:putative transposase
LKGSWVPHDTRDSVVDFVSFWNHKTDISKETIVKWLEIANSKFFNWQNRYGKLNLHNGKVPRDFWLSDEEKLLILNFHKQHPIEGYRRLAFMMNDANIVAVSPSSVYRVLKTSGVMDSKNFKPSKKGTGFQQPIAAHEHWHVDVSYINIGGTFYYLVSVLDGYSRAILAWNLKPAMPEPEIEIVLERARTKYPNVNPRIISDRGPQFVSKEFKQYIRIVSMSHVLTSPYYPQSNGKIERFHRTLKDSAIKTNNLANPTIAKTIIGEFVSDYNNVRLHSALGYIAPLDYLKGHADEIHKRRDERIELAREIRLQNFEKSKKHSEDSNDKNMII